MISDDVIKELIRALPALLTLLMVFNQRRKLDSVHMLVNSSYGVQLRLNAANSLWRAEVTKKKVDIEAAEQAEALLELHEANQAAVDEKEPRE